MTQETAEIRHHVPVTRQSLATWDASRFKRAYRSKGLTLEQLAIRAEIPYSAIRSYSAGNAAPTPERLAKLAEALAVPTTELAPLRSACTLHELRWHAGLRVVDLADRAGYSLSYTRQVLSGVSPITEPGRWTAALKVRENELMRAWEASRAETAEQGGETGEE